MFRYTLYVYLHVPWCSFGRPVHTAACIPRMASRTFIVLPEPQVSFRESRPNYFYELVIITWNHDIAYIMRVCSQAPPWARPCARHVATPIRNKYMHVAKHVQGLILQFARGKHLNKHVYSRVYS